MRIYKLTDKRIPTCSGVYFLWSQKELLYIGKTKNLRRRILQHMGYGLLYMHLVNPEEVWRVSVILTQDEFDAERLEQQLIKLIPTKNNHNWFCKSELYYDWKFKRGLYMDIEDREEKQNGIFQKETGGTKKGKEERHAQV